ncbi:hypothetical protein DL93DRAFT_733086 [Clavulina sp. PMI_390]|nr:hypothetical protein DL93DRAFT_733086 [Clavulina sp. PMI_390]
MEAVGDSPGSLNPALAIFDKDEFTRLPEIERRRHLNAPVLFQDADTAKTGNLYSRDWQLSDDWAPVAAIPPSDSLPEYRLKVTGLQGFRDTEQVSPKLVDFALRLRVHSYVSSSRADMVAHVGLPTHDEVQALHGWDPSSIDSNPFSQPAGRAEYLARCTLWLIPICLG